MAVARVLQVFGRPFGISYLILTSCVTFCSLRSALAGSGGRSRWVAATMIAGSHHAWATR
jgi:hypothetical protein